MRILLVSHTRNVFDGWGRYTTDLKDGLESEHHEVFIISDIYKERGQTISAPQSYLLQPFSFFMPFRFLRDVWIIRRIIKGTRPDLIHITVEPYLLLVPFLGVKTTPVFLTVHGTYSYFPNIVHVYFKKMYKYFVEICFKKISLIISVSQYTKDYLLQHSRVSSDKIIVINNSVSNKLIKDTHINLADKKIIVMVGGVKRRKGILESLRALSVFKQTYNIPFEYRIIGSYREDDQYYKELTNFIIANNLSEEVIFLGRVNEQTLLRNYSEANLFLMLPVSDGYRFEGFGLVYLEANAHGIPTIGSKRSGAVEAIYDGVSGYSVDPNDSVEVSKKIFEVIQGNSISSKNCLRWAQDHDQRSNALKYLEYYSKF